MSESQPPITLLHVDSNPERVGLPAEFYDSADREFVVRTARTVVEGIEQLSAHDIDCVVAAYEMPETTGLEFLETVRERDPRLPFVLFPEDGSEEIAARAIERGITSYVPTNSPTQYSQLCSRVESAVEQYRRQTIRPDEYELVASVATDAFWILDPSTDSLRFDGIQLFGYEEYEPTKSWWEDRLHPEDRDEVLALDEAVLAGDAEAFEQRSDDRGAFTNEYRWQRADGTYADCLERGAVLFRDERPVKMVGTITDVTERRERKQELVRQNKRLEEVAGVISHDLKNPLNVAATRLALLDDECTSEHVEPIERAHDRMERIIDDVLWLAREGREIGSTEPVALATVLDEAWTLLSDTVAGVDLVIESEIQTYEIVADYDRLRQLLDNLLSNALEHGGESVTVRAGRVADGFYIEDTGPGIPPGDRDAVFTAGYTTGQRGTGLGLSIVNAVVTAHGWEIGVTESEAGGARFEITGIKE